MLEHRRTSLGLVCFELGLGQHCHCGSELLVIFLTAVVESFVYHALGAGWSVVRGQGDDLSADHTDTIPISVVVLQLVFLVVMVRWGCFKGHCRVSTTHSRVGLVGLARLSWVVIIRTKGAGRRLAATAVVSGWYCIRVSALQCIAGRRRCREVEQS